MARELKYNTHFTDLDSLQRELGTSDPGGLAPAQESDVDDDGYEDWTGTER